MPHLGTFESDRSGYSGQLHTLTLTASPADSMRPGLLAARR
jgi:hypothetical protein